VKATLVLVILALTSILAGLTIFTRLPRRLVLGWLAVGVCQSVFLLVVGFEFLALLNLLFVAASATVLQLYSALFGTGAIHESEKTRTLTDWIYGVGTGATIAAILIFGLVSTFPMGNLANDLETPIFAKEILTHFPELPWIIGITLFLGIVVWGAVGRPGWKKVPGGLR
jgi:hypothetical protein